MFKVVVGILILLSIALSGCGPSPEEVGEQLLAALNSRDADSVLALMEDDAVIHVDGTSALTGKAEIEKWLISLADLNYRIEGTPVASKTGAAFEGCSISSDLWRYLGTNPMSGTCDVTIEGGQVTGLTIEFDPDSKAKLVNSPAATREDLAAIWNAQGVIPREGSTEHPEAEDWATFYLQFYDDGSARLALSTDDLSTAPDSDHPGASLSWTYEDYILTVQNRGAASEGYCQEQDLGRYMVKNADDDGIQFKPIQDACFWRKDAFRRIGSPWDPYTP